MLNGELKTVIDTEKLNISMLRNATPFFKEKKVVCNIHDCSPIRKPESSVLDGLGVVKSLENKMVSGFDTFNSVMVDVPGHEIRLLSSTPFSNGVSSFVSVSERDLYEKGKITDKERVAEIAKHDELRESHNQKSVIFNQLRSINSHIKSENPHLTVIDIFDRGFDDAELFELETELENEFIVRGKANRNSNEVFIDEKGKEKAIKLVHQRFFKGEEVRFEQISFKNKSYKNALGVFEWNEVEIKGKMYSVLRVAFYQKSGQRVFKDDMIIITSLTINDLTMARLIWELYMQRTKIEAVFKFCKEELKWEAPRIDDWTTMKNLLTLVFFIAGYFYEIKQQLAQDPGAQWLAQLGNGKGKVTLHFLLKGIAKLIIYIEMKNFIAQMNISEDDINEALKTYHPKKINL
jgi:hypothetical protein